MRAEQGGGALRVAVCCGRQDGLVLGRLLLPAWSVEPVGLVPPSRRADQRGLVAKVVEHPDQQRVAAPEVELAVEVAVGQAAFGLIAGAVGAGQGVMR